MLNNLATSQSSAREKPRSLETLVIGQNPATDLYPKKAGHKISSTPTRRVVHHGAHRLLVPLLHKREEKVWQYSGK